MELDPDQDGEDYLFRLASSISDGSKVDWDRAESTATDEVQQDMIRHLRAVADIAQVHRTPPSEQTEQAEPTGSAREAVLAPEQPADSGAPEAAMQRWGHLEILEKIGEGTFGEVYRARDTALDCEVALKLLYPDKSERPALASRMIQEGRLLARVRHNNVARVFGAERNAGRVGVWMEFIRGRTLEDLLEERGKLGADEAIVIGRDLCGALAAVHQAGVVHSDLKTKNVMREVGGRIVLMDFGAGSEVRLRDDQEPSRTAGTPLCMAPELLQGGQATASSDIYSLGVLLFHLVTGTYPVEGRTLKELRQAHERRQRTLLADLRSDLQDAFVGVVEKALEPNPADRYASAGQFEQALAQAWGAATPPPPPLPVPWLDYTAIAISGSRHWRPLVLAGAALGVVAVAFGLSNPVYDVEAALHRIENGTASLLLPGSSISPGDELFLEFKGSKKLYVYVISQDDNGEAFLLFPMVGSELNNPLAPRETHRLPGTREGEQTVWKVTSSGGREHMVVLASRKRLTELEAEIQALARPQESDSPSGSYTPLSEESIIRLRGIGGLGKSSTAATGTGADPRNVFAQIDKLAGREETVRGVWMRRIDLEYANPNP